MVKPFDMIIFAVIAIIIIMICCSHSSTEEHFTSNDVKKPCGICNAPEKMCNSTNGQTCDIQMYNNKVGDRCDPFCNINTVKGCNSDVERHAFTNMELNRQTLLGIDRINLPKLQNQNLEAPTKSVEHFDAATNVQQPELIDQQNNFKEKLWMLSNSSADVVKRVAEINENCECLQGKAISEVYDDLVRIKTSGAQCDGYMAGTNIPHTQCPLRAGVDEYDPNTSLYVVDGANGRCYKPDEWTYENEHGANGGSLYDNLTGADPMWSLSPIVES